MSTVVAVMDRPGWYQNTDTIVVVRPRRRELVWVPARAQYAVPARPFLLAAAAPAAHPAQSAP